MAAYSTRGPSEKQLAYLVSLLHARDFNPPLGDMSDLLNRLRNPDAITNVELYVQRLKAWPAARAADYRPAATWSELRRELRETVDAIFARRFRQPWSSVDDVESGEARYEEAAALLQGLKDPVEWEPLRVDVNDVDPDEAVGALTFAALLLAADDPESTLTAEELQAAQSAIEALRTVWESRIDGA